MLGKITISSVDALGKKYQENVGYTTQQVWSTDTSIAIAFDTFARAVNSLTKNTYEDTNITYEVSINQIIADNT